MTLNLFCWQMQYFVCLLIPSISICQYLLAKYSVEYHTDPANEWGTILIQRIIHSGYWIDIFNCCIVQNSVIYVHRILFCHISSSLVQYLQTMDYQMVVWYPCQACFQSVWLLQPLFWWYGIILGICFIGLVSPVLFFTIAVPLSLCHIKHIRVCHQILSVLPPVPAQPC